MIRKLVVCIMAVAAQSFSTPPLDKPFGGSWIKEAEKKHGRAAMVALPTLALLVANGVNDPVNWLNVQPAETQLAFYSLCGALESINLRRMDYPFKMKPDAEPGQVIPNRLPPLSLLAKTEDAASRMAMCITVVIMVCSCFQ